MSLKDDLISQQIQDEEQPPSAASEDVADASEEDLRASSANKEEGEQRERELLREEERDDARWDSYAEETSANSAEQYAEQDAARERAMDMVASPSGEDRDRLAEMRVESSESDLSEDAGGIGYGFSRAVEEGSNDYRPEEIREGLMSDDPEEAREAAQMAWELDKEAMEISHHNDSASLGRMQEDIDQALEGGASFNEALAQAEAVEGNRTQDERLNHEAHPSVPTLSEAAEMGVNPREARLEAAEASEAVAEQKAESQASESEEEQSASL